MFSNLSQAVLAVVFWLFLGPAQFGGGAYYILVSGNSMDPTLHLGDLVIARQPDQYQIGDIVMYRHPQLGMVIHRIIGLENGHYIFQGDHNAWRDSYNPVKADLAGKLWLHLPMSGTWLKRARESPVIAALAVAVAATIGVVLFAGNASDDQGRRKRSHNSRHKLRRNVNQHQANMPGASMNKTAPPSESLLFCMLISGALAVGCGVIAFGQTTTVTASDQLAYEHLGTFGYTAVAPDGIFDHNYVESGQPVFLKFTQAVTVTFNYMLTSNEVHEVGGFYRLVAEASDATGWKRTIELQPRTPFTGTTFALTSHLNLATVREVIQRMETLTDIHRPQYALTIQAQIFTLGRAGGYGWHDDFAPHLDLVIDDTQLRPVNPTEFSTSLKGTIAQPTTEPRMMSLLMFKLAVSAARILAMVVFALSLVSICIILLLRAKARPESSIESRYGGQLVATAHVNRWPGVVVDVAEIADLMKLAERENAVVLHATDETGHHYFLPAGDTVYHYMLNQHVVPEPV